MLVISYVFMLVISYIFMLVISYIIMLVISYIFMLFISYTFMLTVVSRFSSCQCHVSEDPEPPQLNREVLLSCVGSLCPPGARQSYR